MFIDRQRVDLRSKNLFLIQVSHYKKMFQPIILKIKNNIEPQFELLKTFIIVE